MSFWIVLVSFFQVEFEFKMGFGRWLLLSCVCLVFALEEKILDPIQWEGSLTKMDDTGRTVCNGLATRAQIYKNDVYMCIPRLKEGVEATLVKKCITETPTNTLTEKPCMEPFPAWKPQTEGDCSCLQSAVDIYLDHNNILWVLDVGSIRIPGPGQPPVARCPPKVLGINVETSKIEHTINLAPLIQPTSRIQFIVADYSEDGKCYLYISDAGSKAIIVWDVVNKNGIRVVLPNDVLPDFGQKDVLYLALIKRAPSNLLFFTYRSGENMFCIETKYLQKDASSAKSWDVGKKPDKIIILGTDDWECIYFRKERKSDVYKWNTSTAFIESNFQLVHTGGNLTPTHALADYPRGVMRICESNLPDYLNINVKPNDSINSLTVMQVA